MYKHMGSVFRQTYSCTIIYNFKAKEKIKRTSIFSNDNHVYTSGYDYVNIGNCFRMIYFIYNSLSKLLANEASLIFLLIVREVFNL